MKITAVNAQKLTEHSYYKILFTVLFAAYPLVALTTFRGHRAIPILLLLVAFVALARKVRAWPAELTQWACALALLTAPFYLSFAFGGLEAPTMERVSYGWLFLAIGSAAYVAKPSLTWFGGALVIGAYATLAMQLISGGARPSLGFNPIPYAEVAAAFFCLLCVLVVRVKSPWQVIAIVFGLVGWLIVITLTQTRGAMLAMLPGLAFILAHFAKRFGPKISAGVLLGLIALGWVGDMASGHMVSQRFLLAVEDVQQYREEPKTFSSTAVRLELWRSALMVAREYPMGLGEDGARETAIEWSKEGRLQPYVQPQLKVAHFHSDYLQQLAVTGYIGLIGLLLFYGLLLRHFYQRRDELPGAMGLVFVLSYMVSGLTDVPLYNRLTLFSFFVVITLCFVCKRAPSEAKNSPLKTLKGSVVELKDPMEPVAEDDWKALS
ncbi:O-antigen ligase [Marinimicrobium sp. ABcell2]|uniref:O-antigen ligase family protein n=1 Tax=Marinimicrobium sp. ABcell2 TaxID=3069751 RepID=UPI0027B23000|nr:O-antigen ligase family protein [Marinimicrobium sp. ABcell2]MDQ2078314.1 O-antigen ligase family protein [Marinimicrobium sp. ABcell2]